MLEMIAHASGWKTETRISEKLWEHFPDGAQLGEFVECWVDEVQQAKDTGGSFSEPIGELLEEFSGTNSNLGQFYTPMSVVTMMVQMQLAELPKDRWLNGMDPCCGTGRFMLASLVHSDNLMMGSCDLDLWSLRAAMVNARLLARFTSRFYENEEDQMQPFTEKSSARLRKKGVDLPTKSSGGVHVIAGRARFIHGNSLSVDLMFPFNWSEHSWKWSPAPWEQLKRASETKDEYYERVINPIMKKLGGQSPESMDDVRFDYSLTNKQASR